MRGALDHIVLCVADVERSLAFYSGVLGLAAERVDEWRSGKAPFASVRIGPESIIDLLGPEHWGGSRGLGAGNVDHFCIAVAEDEWEGLLDRLARAGVATEKGPMRLSGARGSGTAIYVRDPDGNRLELRYYSA